MSLYGGIELVGRPDLENIRKVDLLPLPQIARMERVGFGIDLDFLASTGSDFTASMAQYQKEISNYIPADALDRFVSGDEDENGNSQIEINANSAPQIRQLLFSLLNISSDGLKQTSAGLVSTGKKNLELRRADHDVVPLILAYRECSKLYSFCKSLPKFAKWHNRGDCKVCELWHSHGHHRLHGQILTTRAETGRLSMKKPNLQQIPKRSKLGRRIRAAFIAPPGRRMVSVDFSQMELRDLAHMANAKSMIEVYWANQDIHTFTACRAFGKDMAHYTDLSTREQSLSGSEKSDWENFSSTMRLPSKNLNFMICLRSDQNILTNRGYVPICKVTQEMLLWDGLEYVKHDGIVFKGHKEVITYDGVTATPDHKVWTRDGRLVPLAAAVAAGVRLAVGSDKETPIGHTSDPFEPNRDSKRASKSVGYLRRMLGILSGISGDYIGRKDPRMHVSSRNQIPKLQRSIREFAIALSCYEAANLEPEMQSVSGLWGSRNRESFSEFRSICQLRTHTFATSHLRERRDWAQGQRRALCSGEFVFGDERLQFEKYQKECVGRLQRPVYSGGGSIRQVEGRLPRFCFEPIAHETISRTSGSVARHTGTSSQIAPVYDILNAGPRNRFVAEGKIVSNCYGASWKGLQAQLALSGIFWDEIECKDFIARWFNLYPEVEEYLRLQEYRARRYGCVWTPCGRIRLVPEMQSCHPYKRSEGIRQAGNMPIQGANAEQTKLVMGELEETYESMRGEGIDVQAILPIHDEIISETDEENAEAIGEIKACVFRNVMVDKQSGVNCWRVPINADAKISERWARVA